MNTKNKRVFWDDELIKRKIMEVVRFLGISRMPSFQEMKEYYLNSQLTNAISKHGGIRKFSEQLNLSVKNSETALGYQFECTAKLLLESVGHEVEKMTTKHPYDLLVNNAIKVDVKVSRLYKGKQGNFYTFNLEKKHDTCDMYMLFTVDDRLNIINIFYVPAIAVCEITQISIGENSSIYNKYIGDIGLAGRLYQGVLKAIA